jgi:hypothetical protein
MRNETPQFWFRSDLFSIEPGEDEATNPFRFGKNLAGWVADQFRSLGYAPEAVIAEDWGWCVMLSRAPFMLWIGCGNVDSDVGGLSQRTLLGNEVVWSCFVGADVPMWTSFFWKRLLGGRDTTEAIRRVGQELENVLVNEKRIQLTQEP